ncbi:MAG: hypothetical protein AAF710_03940, partial [Planctomycetota bacterium]
MHPLDAALLRAWDTHVTPRLATPQGRAQLTRRLTHFFPQRSEKSRGKFRGLRSFTLTLRANDRRLPDHNTAGAVFLTPDAVARYCAPLHLPPPGHSRTDTAHLLGVGPSALPARVRAGHLIKHTPYPRPSTRSGNYPGDPPRPHVHFYAPPPDHLIHPVPDVQSADWGHLNQHLHDRPRNLPRQTCLTGDAQRPSSASTSTASGGWQQTLFRTVRQLRPHDPKPQYERFEWLCPDCPPETDPLAQRLYWPFRPLNLPAYLNFDFHQLSPELPPQAIEQIQNHQSNIQNPLTPGFTCRRCLQRRFGGQGLTYESTEFTSHNGKGRSSGGKNTWHLFIQRLTLGLLTGNEVPR